MNSTKSFAVMSIYALPAELGRHGEPFFDWASSPVVNPRSVRLCEPMLRRDPFDPVHKNKCTDGKEHSRHRSPSNE